MNIQPLHGVKVLDFSTLLPGPLAGLILAEAGADVVKVERPNGGDDMRRFAPDFGGVSGCFALLKIQFLFRSMPIFRIICVFRFIWRIAPFVDL